MSAIPYAHAWFRSNNLRVGELDTWWVENAAMEALGEIRWYSPWREYCFWQFPQVIMSSECLQEVVNFLDSKNRERRDAQIAEKAKQIREAAMASAVENIESS